MKTNYDPLYRFAPSLYAGKIASAERIKKISRLAKLSKLSKVKKAPQEQESQEIQPTHDNKGALFDSYDWLGNLTGTRLTLQKSRAYNTNHAKALRAYNPLEKKDKPETGSNLDLIA